MKKLIFSILAILFVGLTVNAQTTTIKVLYFKAELSCCMAAACNTMQTDIANIVSEKFDDNVQYELVSIANEANSQLVSKYNAISQTVVLEKYQNNVLVDFTDITRTVKQYAFDKNKEKFTEALQKEVDNLLK
jgi:hypothetical protein